DGAQVAAATRHEIRTARERDEAPVGRDRGIGVVPGTFRPVGAHAHPLRHPGARRSKGQREEDDDDERRPHAKMHVETIVYASTHRVVNKKAARPRGLPCWTASSPPA